jgi:hypothetical protein
VRTLNRGLCDRSTALFVRRGRISILRTGCGIFSFPIGWPHRSRTCSVLISPTADASAWLKPRLSSHRYPHSPCGKHEFTAATEVATITGVQGERGVAPPQRRSTLLGFIYDVGRCIRGEKVGPFLFWPTTHLPTPVSVLTLRKI